MSNMPVRDVLLKEFVDSYSRPLDDELCQLRLANEADNVPLILNETEGFLRMLLGVTRPLNILEIGTAYGYSALFFAKLLPDAHITTIDRNPVMIEAARKNFASHKEGSRIEFRTGEAIEILRALESETDAGMRSRFDFVFIDAGKSHYREYFESAERMAADNAVIVCDNILMKGWIVEAEGSCARRHHTSIKYMKLFLDWLSKRDDLDVTLLTGGDGLAVVRFKHTGSEESYKRK